MKKIIVAFDSFKGCITASEANDAAMLGILDVFPSVEIDTIPVSDGGEGLLDLLVASTHGAFVSLQAHDPLMNLIETQYGIASDGTVLIEMAKICGLSLVPVEKRNPMKTTSYGLGELINHAIGKGCRNFIIGLGGSATNDCGLGMLQALGYRFLDRDKNLLGLGGEIMEKVAFIDKKGVNPFLKDCSFSIACDVGNPLYGKKGAAYIYAPQKGADENMVFLLDLGLKHLSTIIKNEIGQDLSDSFGVGAAGGVGAAFAGFLGATLQSGIDLLLERLHFYERIEQADLIITGEGQADEQSVMGKVLGGILQAGRQYNIPVVAIAGSVSNFSRLKNTGFSGIFPIIPNPLTLKEAMDSFSTKKNITNTVRQVCSLIYSFQK